MLTLEQCENLAKWGLPQELFIGDWYWDPSLGDSQLLFDSRETQFKDLSSCYKIPTLEELMEFAKTLSCDWWLVPGLDGWVVSHVLEGENKPANINNTSPILAVYALIEKLVEVKK